jgi:hypothetical protein
MQRARSRSAVGEVRTFEQLVRGVQDALVEGRRRIERATVFANWETGRLINEHVLLNKQRADYAHQVIPRLEKRTGISERVLYQCAQVHRLFPILNRGSELGWTHYRLLCQVQDEAQRLRLLAAARKNNWTAPELEDRVRQFNLQRASDDRPGASVDANSANHADTAPKLLVTRRGTPGLYPVVFRRDALALDLGFKIYLPLDAAEAHRLKAAAGDIVRVEPDTTLARAPDATKADLFTYRAREVRVIDRDTLAVAIALPPHNEIDKKLRLRGIDCPEVDTAAGKAAKRFVQSLVDRAAMITIATTKPDKYDRYLADVFVGGSRAGSPESGAQTQSGQPGSGSQPSTLNAQLLADGEFVFLNNALLEHGHARPHDGVPADWLG